MLNTRNWPAIRMGVFSLALLLCTLAVAQNPVIPDPAQRREEAESPGAPVNPDATKKILEDNDKDVKKKIQKLYDLVTELKAEADKTDSSKVLNLMLVKKAEEIEKLAHDIKTRSKD